MFKSGFSAFGRLAFALAIVCAAPSAATAQATGVSFSKTSVSCFGGSNGTATATPSGGSGSYDYLWSNGATTRTITGLEAGFYSVWVGDVGNAQAPPFQASVQVNQPSAAVSGTASSTNTAFGGSTGSATVPPAGGVPGYTYEWSNGATTSQINGLLAGSYAVTITDANSCTRTLNNIVVGSDPAPVVLAPPTLPNATAGAAYSQSLSASGGTAPYSYAVTAGATPNGLTLTAGGVLSGTATATGTFNFSVTVTDAASATATRSYAITVAAPRITLAPPTLPGATVGTAYSQTVSATGGAAPYTYAITSGVIPSGLSLTNGALSGTPATAGTYVFTVTATDPNAFTGSRSYQVVVAPAPAPTITFGSASLPGGTTGTAYSQTVSASGGTAPYTYTVTSGNLPTGLTLSSGGALTGTPTVAGNFNFTVTATDADDFTGARSYAVTIEQAVIATPEQIPTLSEWAMILFATILAGIGALWVQRRRRTV